MKLRILLSLAGGALALAACSDSTGLALTGRWATKGIELRTSPVQSELRFPCATVTPMPPLRVDSAGRFETFGRASHSYGSFDVIVQGELLHGTIQADVTVIARGAPPQTTHYILVRNGDPEFGSFACLG